MARPKSLFYPLNFFLVQCLIFFSCMARTAYAFKGNSQIETHVNMSLASVELQGETYIVIGLRNDKHWHTYWKNPGDAGLPIKFEFFLNNSPLTPEALPWPAPKRYIEEGDLWAYGYEGEYSFFFKVNKKELKDKELKAHGKWLVCKDICLPGEQTVNVSLNQNSIGQSPNFKTFTHHKSSKALNKLLNELPIITKRPSNLEIYFTKGASKRLYLQYVLTEVPPKDIELSQNILYPFLGGPLDFKHEKRYFDKKAKSIVGMIPIEWDGEYEEPIWDLPQDGVFKRQLKSKLLFTATKDKRPIIFDIEIKQFALKGIDAYKSYLNNLESLNNEDPKGKKEKASEEQKNQTRSSFFTYLLFAFLGGLILNLMPCVLPVISLKLFGLLVHNSESQKSILRHNVFYTLGVISTFLALALIVSVLKMSGEKVGWGFQLQSPGFVLFMLIIIFVMSLNMFGLFEFITPGGKSLGTKELKKGVSADFINGILATILSTPCSAPFLGTALTFAFTTSYLNIFLIFTSVGIGLAFPFILTGFFPKLIKIFPKPGKWMENLKKLLGLTLLITAAWLYDVLLHIINLSSLSFTLNLLLVAIFFAFYFRQKISKLFAWNLFFFILPVLILGYMVKSNLITVNEQRPSVSNSNLPWKRWSEKKVNSHSGQWVFIDFTAQWCLTCKVNKRLVLETRGFKQLVDKYDIKTYIADWTKRDDAITEFLLRYNIVGVPAYFLKSPSGELISLGEVITLNKVKELIEEHN